MSSCVLAVHMAVCRREKLPVTSVTGGLHTNPVLITLFGRLEGSFLTRLPGLVSRVKEQAV